MEKLASRMMRLFEGYAGAHGTYQSEDRNEAKGGKLEIKRTARTVREPVTEALWLAHLLGQRPLGVITIREDDTCLWGCIDIDSYDVSHTELVGKIESSKLPLLVCRSKSGGAHVLAFFDEPTPAAAVAAALREVAAHLGHGRSEVFPKQTKVLMERGDLGSWLNMPYYGGDKSERAAVKRSGALMSTSEFCTAAERARSPIAAFARARTRSAGPSRTAEEKEAGPFPMNDGPPCLQHLSQEGFPEGTRNTGLLAMGVFAKKKFGSRWKDALEHYNRETMSPPLPSQEVGLVIRSLEKKDYNYKCQDEPLCSHCNSVLCRSRRYGVGWSEEFPLLSGMSILDSDPPLFFVEVEGERLELTSDDLQNYRRFQKVCLERLHVCYQTLKQDTWLRMVALVMKDATIIEVPPDVGLSGQFGELLEDFCKNRHRGERREDILSGKPWQDPLTGKHHFRLRDFQTHLERAGFKQYSRPVIVARLQELGGDHVFLNLDGKGANCWWIPDVFTETPPARPPEEPEEPV